MVLNNIEKLIEKYNNAETTLAEEAKLRDYFAGDNVAPHLEHYIPMFAYFSQAQQEQYTKDVPLKPKRTKLYQWISVAAIIALMFSIFVPTWNNGSKTLADYTPEEQKMYLEAKAALALLSDKFNEGTASINVLNTASENLNAGFETVGYITEFSEATNKLLKN